MNDADAMPWWVSTAFWCGLMLAAVFATYFVYTRYYGEPSVAAGIVIGGGPTALVTFIRSQGRRFNWFR